MQLIYKIIFDRVEERVVLEVWEDAQDPRSIQTSRCRDVRQANIRNSQRLVLDVNVQIFPIVQRMRH